MRRTNRVGPPPRGRLARPAAVLGLLIALASAPAARATSGFAPRVVRATGIARQYFRDYRTCKGGVVARWGRLAGVRPDYTAGLAAQASPDRCTIVYNADVFDNAWFGAGSYRWPMFCTLTVHEFGHLAGLGHSTDPRNVMYPVIRAPIRPCLG